METLSKTKGETIHFWLLWKIDMKEKVFTHLGLCISIFLSRQYSIYLRTCACIRANERSETVSVFACRLLFFSTFIF